MWEIIGVMIYNLFQTTTNKKPVIPILLDDFPLENIRMETNPSSHWHKYLFKVLGITQDR